MSQSKGSQLISQGAALMGAIGDLPQSNLSRQIMVSMFPGHMWTLMTRATLLGPAVRGSLSSLPPSFPDHPYLHLPHRSPTLRTIQWPPYLHCPRCRGTRRLG